MKDQSKLSSRRQFQEVMLEETPSPQRDSSAAEVDLTPYVRQLLRGRWVILSTIGLGMVLGLIVGLVTPPNFTAEASFLPPGGAATGSAALAALSGTGILGSTKTAGDVYAGVLKSHTVLEYVVKQCNLKSGYQTPLESQAEKILKSNTTIDPGAKDSIVAIQVMDKSPIRARDVANSYLDALQVTNEKLALTEAGQRRAFFQKQMNQEKDALADAEVALKKSEEKTGLIIPSSQAAMQVDTIAQTRAQIAGREVELAALRQSSTEQNPDVIRVKSEISDLNRQISVLQHGEEASGNLPTAKVPELELESVRLQREVRYHEALFDILARQFETARLDESKEGSGLEILDRPQVPDRKSGPSLVLILVAGTFLGGLCGIIGVLFWMNCRKVHELLASSIRDAGPLSG